MAKRPIDPQFSLYGGIPDVIDAKATFLELNDPTGYKWALKYLGNYEHYKVLTKCTWFQKALDTWMDELKTKLKSEAIEKVSQIAQGASPQALPAAKYLASAEWEKATSGRGRPSKEELRGELKKAIEKLTIEEEDAQRIGLTLIQGGKA